jgi:hypothetical protein
MCYNYCSIIFNCCISIMMFVDGIYFSVSFVVLDLRKFLKGVSYVKWDVSG